MSVTAHRPAPALPGDTSTAALAASDAGAALISRIDAGIGAHGAWKLKLRTAIRTGLSEITPRIAACDDQCDFGKWLHGPSIDARIRAGVPYQVIRRLHAEFHECAGDILSEALMGRAEQAQEKLDGPFAERSDKLVRALMKWKGELRA